MAEISDGLYENAPQELKETITVELSFRKRKAIPPNLHPNRTLSKNVNANLMPIAA